MNVLAGSEWDGTSGRRAALALASPPPARDLAALDAAIRAQLQNIIKTEDQEERLKNLHEIYRRVHALTSNAGITGLVRLAQMADAVEALIADRLRPLVVDFNNADRLGQAFGPKVPHCGPVPRLVPGEAPDRFGWLQKVV